MVAQFPYTLWVFKQTESTYNPDNGEWSGGSEEWVNVSKCRDEDNGGAKSIVTEDSEVYVFNAVIYLPKNCPKVAMGEKIKVIDAEGNTRIEGNNKLHKKEQLHSRLWL